MQPRSTDPKSPPEFDWAKAFSCFQRNLFKMFIYGDSLVDETIEKWKEQQGNKGGSYNRQQTNTRQSSGNSNRQSNNRNQQSNAQAKSNGNQQTTNGNQQSAKTNTDAEKKQDPEMEKTINGARELYKHLHTDAICNELGIKREKIFSEAQKIWGKSEDWTHETWKGYLHQIANFHNRTGEIYDRLKPKEDAEAA